MWQRRPSKPAAKPDNQAVSVVMRGQTVDITLKWHARARRLILRPDTSGPGATVTLPLGVDADSGIAFAQDRAGWLLKQLSRREEPVPLRDGVSIPFRGELHLIRATGRFRGSVQCRDGILWVPGGAEHLPRRLVDWFRKQARSCITERADQKTNSLAVPRGRITIRDTRSRWGSCSSTGALSFSWRLVLMPDGVLDYVVAHEVAHLVHHNHSPAFWRVAESLTDHMEASRQWLRENGSELHRYG